MKEILRQSSESFVRSNNMRRQGVWGAFQLKNAAGTSQFDLIPSANTTPLLVAFQVAAVASGALRQARICCIGAWQTRAARA